MSLGLPRPSPQYDANNEAQTRSILERALAQVVNFASLTWDKIKNTPTTIVGYGITDNTFANLLTKPTTLSGYGITNAADQEIGSWTPADASGAGRTFTQTAGYTRIGNMVFAYGRIVFDSSASSATALIGGLPFTVKNDDQARQGLLSFSDSSNASYVVPTANAKTFTFRSASGSAVTNAQLSLSTVIFELIYPIT